MKPRTFLLLGGLALIVASCIPSLYPLYHERDLILDERLPGVYGSDEHKDYWKFTLPDESDPDEIQGDWDLFRSGKTYRLAVRDGDVVEEFATHLLILGDHYYLDFIPVNYRIRPGLLEMSLAPSHIFARVDLEEDYLILHFFDPDWLDELIEDDRIRISHVDLGDRYLLTAGTDELQKFILKFANDSSTFMEPDSLLRLSSGIPGQIDTHSFL